MDIFELEHKSIIYRKQILEIIMSARMGHAGSSLSCIDILNVLYNHIMDVTPESFQNPIHDRYVHSKGHAVHALYVILADKGFFPYENLTSKDRFGISYIGHPTREVPGIEINTGALGHGLSAAAGMALAARRDNLPIKVFTTLGDGELAEGSIWEASMFAGHYQLDNLTVIIDRNRLQISGSTESVMGLEPLAEKFKAFRFSVQSIDGNNISEMVSFLSSLPFEKDKPNLIIANTIKGKGISFMEDQEVWHHRVPTPEEYIMAVAELDSAEKEWGQKHHESIS